MPDYERKENESDDDFYKRIRTEKHDEEIAKARSAVADVGFLDELAGIMTERTEKFGSILRFLWMVGEKWSDDVDHSVGDADNPEWRFRFGVAHTLSYGYGQIEREFANRGVSNAELKRRELQASIDRANSELSRLTQ